MKRKFIIFVLLAAILAGDAFAGPETVASRRRRNALKSKSRLRSKSRDRNSRTRSRSRSKTKSPRKSQNLRNKTQQQKLRHKSPSVSSEMEEEGVYKNYTDHKPKKPKSKNKQSERKQSFDDDDFPRQRSVSTHTKKNSKINKKQKEKHNNGNNIKEAGQKQPHKNIERIGTPAQQAPQQKVAPLVCNFPQGEISGNSIKQLYQSIENFNNTLYKHQGQAALSTHVMDPAANRLYKSWAELMVPLLKGVGVPLSDDYTRDLFISDLSVIQDQDIRNNFVVVWDALAKDYVRSPGYTQYSHAIVMLQTVLKASQLVAQSMKPAYVTSFWNGGKGSDLADWAGILTATAWALPDIMDERRNQADWLCGPGYLNGILKAFSPNSVLTFNQLIWETVRVYSQKNPGALSQELIDTLASNNFPIGNGAKNFDWNEPSFGFKITNHGGNNIIEQK